MARLIDADAYKNHLEFYQWTLKKFYPNCRGLIARVISLVDDMETVDAVPVRHGRWVERWVDNKHRIGDMECSVCGAPMLDCPSYSLYCPWCGARMNEAQKKPCDDCQEFDCYGCEYAERKEE